MDLEDGRTAPCRVKIEDASAKETILTVVLHEGKKRQIRRIFDSIGHRVLDLERIQYGPLGLGNLRPGQKRELKPSEIQSLERATQPPTRSPKTRG